MKFLLLGGQPNTGKTETAKRIARSLVDNEGYEIINKEGNGITGRTQQGNEKDFLVVLEKEGVLILINSASDIEKNMIKLDEFIKNYSPHIVITSIRDGWKEREWAMKVVTRYSSYCFEIPLARVTRRHPSRAVSMNWYRKSIDKLIEKTLNESPYSISIQL